MKTLADQMLEQGKTEIFYVNPIVSVLILVAMVSFGGLGVLHTVEAERERIACAQYAPGVAQKLYDTDSNKYARLDRDHDGLACE